MIESLTLLDSGFESNLIQKVIKKYGLYKLNRKSLNSFVLKLLMPSW